jgi:hypothetical protein
MIEHARDCDEVDPCDCFLTQLSTERKRRERLEEALKRSVSGHELTRRELWAHVPAGPSSHWMIALQSTVRAMEDDARAALEETP